MTYWYWMGLGLVLLIVEMLTPGIWFLWPGLAALACGLVALLLPLPGVAQWIVFALLSIASAWLGRRWYTRRGEGDDKLNNRHQALLGRQVRLSEAIVAGEGVVNIDDTRWPVQGDDMAAGVLVEVVAAEGSRLKVRAVE